MRHWWVALDSVFHVEPPRSMVMELREQLGVLGPGLDCGLFRCESDQRSRAHPGRVFHVEPRREDEDGRIMACTTQECSLELLDGSRPSIGPPCGSTAPGTVDPQQGPRCNRMGAVRHTRAPPQSPGPFHVKPGSANEHQATHPDGCTMALRQRHRHRKTSPHPTQPGRTAADLRRPHGGCSPAAERRLSSSGRTADEAAAAA